MSTGHGAGIALKYGGNEGWASVSEDDDGNVTVEIGGSPATLRRVTFTVLPEGAAIDIVPGPAQPGGDHCVHVIAGLEEAAPEQEATP